MSIVERIDEYDVTVFDIMRMKLPALVVTNGCFDVLHEGHVQLLKFAHDQGSHLVVLINSDESVKKLKGDKRPVNTLRSRIEVLKAIRWVHWVIPFFDDTPEFLLSNLKPAVLVKGSEYKGTEVPGSQYARRTVFAPMVPGVSTTITLSKGG